MDGRRAQCAPGAWRRFGAPLAAMVLSSALAGCGMSSLTSGLGGGIFGGGSTASTTSGAEPVSVNEAELLSAAKAADPSATGSVASDDTSAGCPKVIASSRDNNLTIYEQGRAGDGLAIMHRGEITKAARECQISGNQVTVKVGFAGRILLGPRGKTGPIALPVTLVITDAKRDKIATDKMKIDTTLAVENPIGYFSAVRTVTFALPEGTRPGEFEVNLAFDRTAPGAG